MDIDYTHTRIYIQLFFKKNNCFIYRLKVFRSGAFLISYGREFQVEIAKQMRHNQLFFCIAVL